MPFGVELAGQTLIRASRAVGVGGAGKANTTPNGPLPTLPAGPKGTGRDKISAAADQGVDFRPLIFGRSFSILAFRSLIWVLGSSLVPGRPEWTSAQTKLDAHRFCFRDQSDSLCSVPLLVYWDGPDLFDCFLGAAPLD
jgi:hypothetical protein